MSIRELPDKWREQSLNCQRNIESAETEGFDAGFDWREHNRSRNIRADELEAALPVWTRITEDPETRPEKHEWVVAIKDDEFGIYSGGDLDIGDSWRPKTDLDFPPE